MNYNPTILSIGEAFVKIYYEKMNQGINHAMELFHPNVLCTLGNESFQGSYNWLLKMVNANTGKIEYRGLSLISHPISNYDLNGILINVTGFIKVNGYWGEMVINGAKFSEVFIIEKFNDNYLIKNYILKVQH